LNLLPKNKKLRALLLCIISGALLGFSFPPFKTWYFIYFGLMILIYLVINAERFRHAFSRAYIAMFVFNEITLYWISGWHSNDTFLKIGGVATVVVHSFFMLIPLLITYGVSRIKKELALGLFPMIWVGYEYFDNVWQFAFPWLELGNSETYNLGRIQIVEFTGVHGLTFMICVISVILFFTISNIYNRKWKASSPKAIAAYVILLILILLPNFYSSYRLNSVDNTGYFNLKDPAKVVNTCIVQTNTDPFKKWGGDHDQLLNTYLDGLHEGLKFNPDMLVLHETATPFYFLEDINFLKSKRFFDFVDSTGKYLVMGIPHKHYYAENEEIPSDHRVTDGSKRKFDVFNSAILIEPHKYHKDLTIHKKVKLVPFSERMPYQEKVPFAKKWFTWGVGISGWQMGNDMNLFSLKDSAKKIDTKFSTLICYESVFSEYVTEYTKAGAEYYVIVTNDGWWGNTSGPEQHNQYAVLRAIENRKWIVRCAQTGVSCFIDPLGNMYDEIPYWQTGVAHRNIIANTEKTFYSENGDIIGMLGFYTGTICIICSILFYVKRRKVKRSA
jgi:apolipoprotein N-acyltransferase